MKRLLVLIATPFLLCHCASISTLQTARVLEKGESQHNVGVGFYTSDDFLGGEDLTFPMLEYSYRMGVWDKIDAGLKISLIGTAVLDAKYNLVNGENFALATGLGLGYLSIDSGPEDAEMTTTIIDVILPLYASYDISKMFGFYSAGKFLFRSVSADGEVEGDGSMLSATLGIKYGDSSGVMLEGSLLSGLDSDFTGSQFNFGVFFEI
ncbi:MAG: hypothetical protein AAF203_08265 [Pseudomonadota bacterium]